MYIDNPYFATIYFRVSVKISTIFHGIEWDHIMYVYMYIYIYRKLIKTSMNKLHLCRV